MRWEKKLLAIKNKEVTQDDAQDQHKTEKENKDILTHDDARDKHQTEKEKRITIKESTINALTFAALVDIQQAPMAFSTVNPEYLPDAEAAEDVPDDIIQTDALTSPE